VEEFDRQSNFVTDSGPQESMPNKKAPAPPVKVAEHRPPTASTVGNFDGELALMRESIEAGQGKILRMPHPEQTLPYPNEASSIPISGIHRRRGREGLSRSRSWAGRSSEA
jgi:hypothetical protein